MLSDALDIEESQLSSVIKEYTRALDLLDDYDYQRKTPDTIKEIQTLTYKEARRLIDSMKFGENSNVLV